MIQDGVAIAADTRSTGGATVGDKNCFKIHYLAPNIYGCGAGTAADCDHVTERIKRELEMHRFNTHSESRVQMAAGRFSSEAFKYGGNLGETGVASHQFRQAGVIRIDKNNITDNEMIELAINGGAEDCSSNDDFHEIITLKENFYKVKVEIEKKIKNFISSGIEWLPINKISLDQEKTKSVLSLLEKLEDDDDVQYVYANLEIDNKSLLKESMV